MSYKLFTRVCEVLWISMSGLLLMAIKKNLQPNRPVIIRETEASEL